MKVSINTEHKTGGVVSFVSWDRLLPSLHQVCKIKDHEKITQIDIRETGITVYIKNEEDAHLRPNERS